MFFTREQIRSLQRLKANAENCSDSYDRELSQKQNAAIICANFLLEVNEGELIFSEFDLKFLKKCEHPDIKSCLKEIVAIPVDELESNNTAPSFPLR